MFKILAFLAGVILLIGIIGSMPGWLEDSKAEGTHGAVLFVFGFMIVAFIVTSLKGK